MVLPSGSLQIAKSTIEDAGTYMCVAQNPAGTALGKIKLKVQGKSSFKLVVIYREEICVCFLLVKTQF